jgi:uncharacterized protein (TIGR00251 family)
MHPPRVADALTASAEGCIIAVTVRPGRNATRFPDGYDPWRRRVTASVAAPARHGAANQALVDAAARFFGLPPASVRLVEGATGRQKRLLVATMTPDEAARRLAGALDAEEA